MITNNCATASTEKEVFIDYGLDRCELRCIHDLFAEQAHQRPGAVAIRFEERCVTYAELDRRSNQLAHSLRKLGVGPDVYVTVLMGRSVDLIVGLLAILKAGGAYAPLSSELPTARLAFMLEDTNAPVLLTESRLKDKLPQHDSTVVCIDDDWQEISLQPDTCPVVECKPDNLAYVNYTSGSTGQPKGVEVEHRGVTRLVKKTNYANFDAGEKFLQLAPITFDAATFEIWGSLLNGAQLVVFPDHTPSLNELGECIQSQGITTLWLTAGLFHKMVEQNLESLRNVRQLLTGGDVVSAEHAKKYLEFVNDGRLINGYGPTENTTFTTCYSMTAASEIGNFVPIGTPISNTQVYILDNDRCSVPKGEVGELYTGGNGLARGYLNQPALTLERFIPNPFDNTPGKRLYRTGDLARYLPSGNIEFLGRTDDQVKIRGFRIELEEIKAVLRQHRAVRDATVVAQNSESGEKRLVAYIVPDTSNGQNGEPQDAANHLTNWQALYDQLYDPSVTVEDPTFNIVGWDSSYTGKPIAAEEMREWVDHTVERIESLHPKRVLEIGCGTGLLLHRVAPNCSEYLGTDLSPVAICDLKKKLRESKQALPQVKLLARPADNFEGIESKAYDTVILNSVVQYFPTINYLREVIANAVRCVSPGGHIFIGDIRNLRTLEAFYLSIQLANSSAETPLGVIKQRIATHVLQEDELVIDPAFFTTLNRYIPEIAHVEVQPKRGVSHNELTKFRYDVVLHVGQQPVSPLQHDWIDWQVERLTLEKLGEVLSKANGGLVGVKNIPNARLQEIVAANSLLSNSSPETKLDEIRNSQRLNPAVQGASPEDIHLLAVSLGYEVNASWINGGPDGAFDAVFYPQSHQHVVLDFESPGTVEMRMSLELATSPTRGKTVRTLPAELQHVARQHLPEYMVPSQFVLLDTLPLNSNGKVDRKALPPADIEYDRSPMQYEPPRDELEQTLVEIWQDVLGAGRIGIQENFFHLGGSSLLAAEMFLRIGRRFQKDLPLAILAKHPTIEKLADVLRDDQTNDSWSSLVPIQTAGTRTPLFCVHGGGGNVLSIRELSQMLGDDQPFYALQWNGLDGGRGLKTIEAMAADYLKQIRSVQSSGPYFLAGHCVGGLVAYEMAQQLANQGETAAIVVMFDTPNVKSNTYHKPTLFQWIKQNWLITAIRYRLSVCTSWITRRRLDSKWTDYNERENLNSHLLAPIVIITHQLMGRRVPTGYRQTYVQQSMIAAARRYHPKPYAGRIAYLHAGTEKVRRVVGFMGQLIDGMFGWSPMASENFEFYSIRNGGHNSIVTDPESAEVLMGCLDPSRTDVSDTHPQFVG